MAREFLKRDLQVIVFAQSRLATEILTTYLKDDFAGRARARPTRSAATAAATCRCGGARSSAGCARAACAPSSRPTRSSSASTSARSTSSVLAGYPGTIAATWQRAGRAGRRSGRSAAVLVASSAPLDQFVVRHPVVLLRRLARARAHQPRQPAHPARPRQVRGLRAAVQRRRAVRRDVEAPTMLAACLSEEGLVHQRPTGSGTGRASRIRPTPSACGRSRRTTSSSSTQTDGAARHRRDRLHQRAVDAPREGHLHRRGAALPGGAARLRGPQGLRARRSTATTTPTRSPTRRSRCSTSSPTTRRLGARAARRAESGCRRRARTRRARGRSAARTARGRARARRGARRLARGRLQEDQVLHERERRLGRARSARAADAHDVVLADDVRAALVDACRTRPTTGATASAAWRTRCGPSRSCC